MEIRYPKYYHQFQCIASACEDSCCKEWEVDVDEVSAAYYRSLHGELGDALREVLVDTEDGTVMTIRDRRCPMWRDDGLCRIQAALGHDALCATCRDFPRLRHDYGDFVELGLELSCPEAARMILAAPCVWVTEQVEGGEAPDYDEEAMVILRQSREIAVEYLYCSVSPVPLRLATLLVYAHHVQSWLDGGAEAQISEAATLELLERVEGRGDWNAILDFFKDLEILTPQWSERLANPEGSELRQEGYVHLAAYFIGRYWLQAVSDYDLIGRVKFMVVACLLICRLGGDFVQTAQQFSKEIENDADNVEAILDGAYGSPALTDMNLLRLLKTL